MNISKHLALGVAATLFTVLTATAGGLEDWRFYAGNGTTKNEVDMASVTERSALTYFTYRYHALDDKFARLNKTMQAVVNCQNNLRSDVSPDGSYELRPIYPNTDQAAQLDLVCRVARNFESASPVAASVLVLGGASHTQAGFPDPHIQNFYVTTAVDAAEKLSQALTAAGVRNTKFIDWSRSIGYQQEMANNIAACSCNFVMQVSFGKNMTANPQTLFFEYQLLYLAKTASTQPGMNAVRTEERFRRKYEVPVSQAGFVAGNYEVFAREVITDVVREEAFRSGEKPQ